MYETQENGAVDALVDRSGTRDYNQETLLVHLQALYPYSYAMPNGQQVSFEAGDYFELVSKSTPDWWHVRRGNEDFYVPASYVCESVDLGGEEESTEGSNGQGENTTLSPSSEGSFQDFEDFSNRETTGTEESTSFGPDEPERIYANIPVIMKDQVKKRHSSSGEPSKFSRPKSATLPTGWVVKKDDNSGQNYYVNTKTNETSWQAPRPDSHYSDASKYSSSLPRGWRLQRQESVEANGFLYVNDSNNEMWQSSKDDAGRTYYFNVNDKKTSWELPTFDDTNSLTVPINQNKYKLTPRHRMSSEGSEHSVVNLRQKSPQLHLRSSKSASMIAGLGLTAASTTTEMSSFIKGHQWKSSDQTRNSLILSDDFPPPPVLPELNYSVKKEGTINRKKLCEKGGKRLKKLSWSPCYVKLSSTNMIMYKNQSAATPKPGSLHGRPESSCDLRGTVIEKMPDEGKRRNIFQIATVSKLCFLLQVDDVHEFSQWYHMIADVVKYLNETDPLEHGMQAKLYGDVELKPPLVGITAIPTRGSLKKMLIRDGDKKNIRDKLKKLITRRPTMEELQKKGIMKDLTFGCHITRVCARENTNIPRVVTECVAAIEAKGLDFDGLYRISGNVSAIQQLRIIVDQEEKVRFGERPFDDVHVLTGTLKLYFRELPEPLFPWDSYDGFVDAIKLSTKKEKTDRLRTHIDQLPWPNSDTLRYLFRHLRRVMENSQKNRMHAHNIAIVFGPTLLAPREEHGNIAVNTVYQNQIVEYILLEYDNVLGKDS